MTDILAQIFDWRWQVILPYLKAIGALFGGITALIKFCSLIRHNYFDKIKKLSKYKDLNAAQIRRISELEADLRAYKTSELTASKINEERLHYLKLEEEYRAKLIKKSSILYNDNSFYHFFWLGHDIQWTISILSQPNANVKDIIHGLNTSLSHLLSTNLKDFKMIHEIEKAEVTFEFLLSDLLKRIEALGLNSISHADYQNIYLDSLVSFKRQAGILLKNISLYI